jgi:plastocyanin
MTWPWRTCFSVLAVLPLAGYTVSGHVRLADSLVSAVRKHSDYAGVVVWLEPLGPVPAGYSEPRPQHARMEQKDKRFVPHILVVQVGAGVSFPNLDPIFHSAFSNFSGQVFDLGLYAPGTSRLTTFDRPGIVRVFCNIHPTMSAVIVVLKHPWFTVSNGEGAFSVAGVPPGRYRLHVFHERATAETLRSLDREIAVSSELSLAPITISETGYIEVPHKNKYGQEYPPVPDDHGVYPMGHK